MEIDDSNDRKNDIERLMRFYSWKLRKQEKDAGIIPALFALIDKIETRLYQTQERMKEMAKLNQIIAVEKGVKSRTYAAIGEIHKAVQKPQLFEGFHKNYKRKNDEDETFPAEAARVQLSATDVLRTYANQLTEIFDITSTKDWANTKTGADVVVDGTTLIQGAPATFLLFLEKQLNDLHTAIAALPVLDPAQNWTLDPNSSLYKTEPLQTVKTRKVSKPIVLYAATPEHPAQTQLIQEDVIVGHWETVKMSGAIPAPRKVQLLEKVQKLQKAVKFAREQANNADAPEIKVGEKLFSWLLS